MKVAIVGVGSMGGAIMQGLNNLTKYDLIALNPKNPRVEKLAHEYKFKLVFDPPLVIGQVPHGLLQQLSLRGQDQIAPIPGKQLDPILALQIPDLGGNRGLGQVQLAGRLRKVEQLAGR